MSMWDRRLLVVMGKGGVGKTTCTAAMGLAAAASGKRVCLLEIDGAHRLATLFGRPRQYAPQTVSPGVDLMSMTARECTDDFGTRKLRLGGLSRVLFNNRILSAFLDAVPGLNDLLQLGKVENMLLEPLDDEPHYDLIVLDAPATGHGLTLLSSARSMTEMTRSGPFYDLARKIDLLVGDTDKTATVVVTLPEELPINEATDLIDALSASGPPIDAVLVNRTLPDALEQDGVPWNRVRASLDDAGPAHRQLADLCERFVARRHAQQAAIRVLRSELAERNLDVPVLAVGQRAELRAALGQLGLDLRDAYEQVA